MLDLLGGQEGMVLDDGRLVGSIGPQDVERWYQRQVNGDAPARTSPAPPRPDL